MVAMINSPTLEMLCFRHQAKKAIRTFFDNQGFVELDPPYILSTNTPDPFIDPIFIKSKNLSEPLLQLHTSPEIWLKRGLGLGLKKTYHMGRVFRDDPPGKHHSVEFTMLEWYRVGAELGMLIDDCRHIFTETIKAHKQPQSEPLSFIRVDLDTLFKDLANLDLTEILHQISKGRPDYFQQKLAEKEFLPKHASFSDAFFHVMLKYIEPNLPLEVPVVISRFPVQLAALAAPCQDNPHFCDRFEIYFRGLEIANAYQECNDPEILRQRFIRENCARKALDKPSLPIDENFLKSIADLPKTAGIALGIDRLFLAISGRDQISDVIFGFRDH